MCPLPLRWIAWLLVACPGGIVAFAAETASTDELYRARNWFGLAEPPSAALSPLQHAALAAAFLKPEAETLLGEVIRMDPKSADAMEAHQWLSQWFFQRGQYRELAENLEQQARSFPENASAARARETFAGFHDLPSQTTLDRKRASVSHDGGLFVPVTANDAEAYYFIDTGAAISSCSESEAKRLGLRFVGEGKMGTSNTQHATYRAAVAETLTIGGLRLRNVGFAVFPDAGEPWVNLAPGRRGLLGWPVIMAAGGVRWRASGTAEFGEFAAAPETRNANLCMMHNRPAVRVTIEGRAVTFALDSGAVNTDIYALFGTEFPALVASGKRRSIEVRGVGGVESHDGIDLPDLALELGATTVRLSGAGMMASQVGPEGFVGNLGFDVLRQKGGFVIDLRTMRVNLILAGE